MQPLVKVVRSSNKRSLCKQLDDHNVANGPIRWCHLLVRGQTSISHKCKIRILHNFPLSRKFKDFITVLLQRDHTTNGNNILHKWRYYFNLEEHQLPGTSNLNFINLRWLKGQIVCCSITGDLIHEIVYYPKGKLINNRQHNWWKKSKTVLMRHSV